MGAFSVGGLGSGLDTARLIDQLMSIEGRGRTRLEWNRNLWEARKSGWTELQTRLNTLATAATKLNTASTWDSVESIFSSDTTKLTGSFIKDGGAISGDHKIGISALATTEVWSAAAQLKPATSGVRTSGAWSAGASTPATSTTRLVNLTDASGLTLGLDAGSKITLSADVNGTAKTATFSVTSTSTLGEMISWAQAQFTGASFAINGDGTVTYTSAPGTANEIKALSYSAVSSLGATDLRFNIAPGATTTLTTAASDNGVNLDQTLSITQGTSVWNVALKAGWHEADVAAAINGTAGIGVTASVVGGKLQLASNASGAQGSFTLSSTGTVLTDIGMAEARNGVDAAFTVNGIAHTRSTNTVGDAITGVNLNLLAVTSADVDLKIRPSVKADPEDVKKAVADFVTQYNAVIDYINARTAEKKVANPKTAADYVQGSLGRNQQMVSIAGDLRRWAAEAVSDLPMGKRMLPDIGISSGAVSGTYSATNTSGKLVIDDAKLLQAITNDPNSVKDLFTKVGGTLATDGIARRMSALTSEFKDSGVSAGVEGASSQIKQLQDTLERFSARLERKRSYYEAMFSRLENRVGRLQAQGQWLQGQLGGMQ